MRQRTTRGTIKASLLRMLGNIPTFPELPPPWSNETITYVDIGARGGPPSSWLKLTKCVDYVCFEPDPDEAKLLEKQFNEQNFFHATVVQKALGASQGEAQLHLTKFRPSSSLLLPNKTVVESLAVGEGFTVEAVIPVKLSSLDDEMSCRGISPDFVKADVQGYELEVLKGAEHVLSEAIGCELEVSFVEIYQNQPLWAEVDSHMRSKGFFLADFERVWWRRSKAPAGIQERGTMAYGNATYLKNDITLPRNREDVLRNSLVSAAIGLDEIAYETVNEATTANLLTESEKESFELWLARRNHATAFWTKTARRLSKVPGRRTFGRWLGLWSRSLAGDSDTKADSESWLRRNSW